MSIPTNAQTIASRVNSERKQQFDAQKTRDTNDFVNACNKLRSVSDLSMNPWGNNCLQQCGSVRFEKRNYCTYAVYCKHIFPEAVTQQMDLFRTDGFQVELVENILSIKNPHLEDFYDNEQKQLHGWPYSADTGFPFLVEIMNQCRILGIHKINIDFLDETNRSQVITFLQGEGYTVTSSRRGSDPPRIIAVNPRGESRLTMTVRLE